MENVTVVVSPEESVSSDFSLQAARNTSAASRQRGSRIFGMRERDTTTFGSGGDDRGILVRMRPVCPSHIRRAGRVRELPP